MYRFSFPLCNFVTGKHYKEDKGGEKEGRISAGYNLKPHSKLNVKRGQKCKEQFWNLTLPRSHVGACYHLRDFDWVRLEITCTLKCVDLTSEKFSFGNGSQLHLTCLHGWKIRHNFQYSVGKKDRQQLVAGSSAVSSHSLKPVPTAGREGACCLKTCPRLTVLSLAWPVQALPSSP